MSNFKQVAKFIFATFFVIQANDILSQDQRKADSLIQVLNQKNLKSATKLSVLKELASASSSPQDVLNYAEQLKDLSIELDDTEATIVAFELQGVALRMKGDLQESLQKLFGGAELALNNDYFEKGITVYLEIANTYTTNQDFRNALEYEKKAIELIRNYGDQKQLSINLLNTGYSYYNLEIYDSALQFFNEAEPIFREIKLDIGTAYTLGNRALVYWKLEKKETAINDLLAAIEMLKPLGDDFGMSDYHNQLGNIYLEENKIEKSIYHSEVAFAMASQLDLKEQIRDGAELLSRLYSKKSDFNKAFEYQSIYVEYRDSIENSEQTKLMANMRTEFEVSLREKEIDTLEKDKLIQRNYIVIALILLVLSLVIMLYFRLRLRNARLLAANDRRLNEEKVTKLLSEQETKALQSIIKGREEERKRLAQELHNHLGSLFATVKVNLNGLDQSDSPQFGTIHSLVDQACSDIRSISHSLNMGVSENFGLIPALKELTDHLSESGMIVEFSASMSDSQMTSEQEILTYRIIQELVSNVLKHAKAEKISVLLTYFPEDLLLNIMVQDDGIGFDFKSNIKGSDGMGLQTLEKMVDNLQGDITFDSNPQSGTTVNIDLPIEEI